MSAPPGADAPPRRSGAFVVVVGPDGVGKTAVARALLRCFPGPTAYFHFTPPTTGELAAAPPEHSPPPPSKGTADGFRVVGWVRLTRNFLRFWLGYLRRVRPAVRRGALVVGDRWAYGYVAQPRALRFHGPRGLARLAIRALPRPDLVANLHAPPDVIRARKQELTVEEIEAELAAWASVPEPRLRTFDAAALPEVIAQRILQDL